MPRIYPDVINENAARLTAFFIMAIAALTAIFTPFQHEWSLLLLGYLTFGFLIRSTLGPQAEPLALLVAKVLVPVFGIGKVPTNALPKRFAQTIGLLFSVAGIGFFLLNQHLAYQITFGILSFFAFLESFFGFCAGCFMFNQMIRFGILPESICVECNDITARLEKLSSQNN